MVLYTLNRGNIIENAAPVSSHRVEKYIDVEHLQ